MMFHYCYSLNHIHRFMTQYDDETLQPIPPILAPGEKEHMLLPQDETSFHTNNKPQTAWLKDGQQPLKSKGNG